MYQRVNQALPTWLISILGNSIPISGSIFLKELRNLLTHLIATLSRHQADGLKYGVIILDRSSNSYLSIETSTPQQAGGFVIKDYFGISNFAACR